MGIVGAVEKLEGACGRACGANLWGKPGLGQGRRRKKEKKEVTNITPLIYTGCFI
jgi:hypothetical protein